MKRILIMVLIALLSGVVWGETNQSQLKEQARVKDQTKAELQIRDRIRDKIGDQECDKLMDQIRERIQARDQYQENIEFVAAYMERKNASKDPADLLDVSGYYQKNNSQVTGTAKEKRNTLLSNAEKMVQTRNQNGNNPEAGKKQIKEKSSSEYNYRYQNKIQQKNMGANSKKVSDITQKKNKEGSPKK